MNPAGRMLLFPLSWSLLCLGVAIVALTALSAEAQPGANWTASGMVSMSYRTELGGTVFGRSSATIHQTAETDIIAKIDIGSPFGGDTPGSLSISGIGDSETPRDLGDVEVDVGSLSLTSSFVDGFIRLTRPEASMSVLLTEMAPYSDIVVLDGATLTGQASTIYPNAREGSTVRLSACIGIVDSLPGADVEIDQSEIRRARFYGKQVITNSSITGVTDTHGEVRWGEFDFENVSLDVENSFGVGGGGGDAPADTVFILTSSIIESGTGTVRSGVDVTTDFEMRGSVWRSFGPFAIQNSLTQVEIESGSRIDARTAFRIGGATATIGSTTETPSRIDVAGNFDLEGTLPGTLTIEDGGIVDVDGTLTIGQLGTLNLNDGGTLRVGNLVFEQDGVLNENGGTLIVPEATGIALPLAAVLALALLRRRRD